MRRSLAPFAGILVLLTAFLSPLGAQENLSPSALLDSLETRWNQIQDYTMELHSFQKKGEKTQNRVYAFRYMRPGWIYLHVLEGDGKGAHVVYNPQTDKVRAKKGGLLSVIKLTLSPDDKRVLSIRGFGIKDTPFDVLLRRWRTYLQTAQVQLQGPQEVEGQEVYVLEATGVDPTLSKGADREVLYLRSTDFLPVGFDQYEGGELVHRVRYKDLRLNVGLTEEDFKI